MTAEKIPSNQLRPVISANLGKLLGAVFLLFALLVVNSLYLVSITMLEQASGEIYQDYFDMLMFLVHLGLGLLLMSLAYLWVAVAETVRRAVGSVAALVLGRWIFHEPITLAKVVGVALMSVGVALILL